MKKNAKQTLADLKSQATSTEDLMRKLAQWDENGEMPEETKRKITGGALISEKSPVLNPLDDIATFGMRPFPVPKF